MNAWKMILSFPFLSFPFLSFPFLSFPFLSFPFLSFRDGLFSGVMLVWRSADTFDGLESSASPGVVRKTTWNVKIAGWTTKAVLHGCPRHQKFQARLNCIIRRTKQNPVSFHQACFFAWRLFSGSSCAIKYLNNTCQISQLKFKSLAQSQNKLSQICLFLVLAEKLKVGAFWCSTPRNPSRHALSCANFSSSASTEVRLLKEISLKAKHFFRKETKGRWLAIVQIGWWRLFW